MPAQWKALFISDVHMSNSLPMAEPIGKDGLTDRLACQLEMWGHVLRSAKKNDVECIVIAGDLFDHSRVDAITLAETMKALRKISAEFRIYILPGNHEAVSVRGERFTTEVFAAMQDDRIRYISKFGDLETPAWLGVWPVPYSTNEAAKIQLKEIRKSQKRMKDKGRLPAVRLGILHHSILGAEHENNTCEIGISAKVACGNFDHVVSGHFHTPQKFGRCGMYCGAPLHFRFDDADRKAGWWILQIQEGRPWKRTFVKSKTPRFHSVTWPEKAQGVQSGDYVKIVLNCTHAERELLQGETDSYGALLRSEGARVKITFQAVYHHAQRLRKKKRQAVSLTALISEYVKDSSVDVKGLDVVKLEGLGLRAIESALKDAER